MDLGNLMNSAKDALAGKEDQVSDGLEKAADFIKDRTDDSVDEKIDMAVDKAQDFLEDQKKS